MTQTNLMWSNLGPIRADMALDHVPKQAGVHKLTFKLWGNTYTYIGEAGARGLRARVGDHANHPPAEGNKAEHLLHDRRGRDGMDTLRRMYRASGHSSRPHCR